MRILRNILVLLFVTTVAVGQQINPVPDYIFRNQMSVGRNAPTDTAAYLSIGPRFGANRGIMPPMVVDTNAVTGVKRNGLLIFSVQLNNFAYWDSTTSRFRRITAEAVVDSLQFATRAWRRKGDDSLAAIINTKTDTALLSTRAYRQKGVDSLVTLISTLGGGTVLSVSAGTGMNFTTITTSGSVSADTNVLSTRAWRRKGDDSLGAIIAGKVNISDTATMLSAYLRKADTTSMLSPYLRKADTTVMLAPYVRNAGFGLTKGTQALSVDSALMATRARVQKGIDSVASLVTTIDSLRFATRAWRQKGDDSVAAIANSKATATGTTNYLSKFTGTSSLGNSIVYATTSEVGISTPSPTHPLDVNGRVRIRIIDSVSSPINMVTVDNDGVVRKAVIPSVAVDTVLVSTRAWRQKGDDSLGAIIATKGSGTVTSVGSGFGTNFSTITSTGSVVVDSLVMTSRASRDKLKDSLQANINAKGSGTVTSVAAGTGMSFTTITTTGSVSADTVALATRAWRQKGIDSLANVRVGGSGTTNRVAKFTASGTVGNGSIADSASSVAMTILGNNNIGIGTATPDGRLDINSSTASLVKGLTLTAPFLNGTNNGQSISLRPAGSTQSYSGIDMAFENLFVSFNSYLAFRTGTFATPYTERMRLTPAGRLLIGTTTEGTYRLDVTGTGRFTDSVAIQNRLRVTSIDSSASPINMLWSDNSGVIRKTSIPTTSVDTNTISTRAWRQKGIDSVAALPRITGSGTINTIPKFTGSTALGNSLMTDNGTTVGIDVSSPISAYKIHSNGGIKLNSGGLVVGNPFDSSRALSIAGNAFQSSIYMEQYGNDGLDLFMIRGNGTVSSKSNVDTPNTIGTIDFAGYVDGQRLQSAALSALVSSVDTVNNRAAADMRFTGWDPLLNSVNTNAAILANGGHLEIRGYLKSNKIDSTASAINMLYADASGVIKKTAVPAGSVDSVKMRSNTITAASGWTIGEETAANTSINQVVRTEDLASNTTIHVNTILYRTTNTFTTGSWVTIGTVPVGYRPTNVVYFSLPNLVDGASFQATNNTDFTAVAQYSGGTSLRIKANGEIDVYVTTVDASADLSGANYVLIPVVVSYPILTLIN